ncbi:tetratricopeptide repeat-containing sensor histidine kinase [Maribacter flavus]|uniref:tetratricopeptide repeat-containing sensor histidine kinase n=1 Tax=Maribacter flavus TaxID=1658664 RepID=UPI001376342F|nr:tetratricopeptide repeat protein [Maribacter flavus]
MTTIALPAQQNQIDSLKIEFEKHTINDSIRVDLLNQLAYAYRRTNAAEAIAYLEESETITRNIGYLKGKAKNLYLRGVMDAIRTDYREGFLNYEKAVEIYGQIGWKKGIAECYKDMGVFMSRNSNQGEALRNYRKSLEILNELGEENEVAVLLFNIGWTHAQNGNYEDARANYFKAVRINEKLNENTRLSSCLGSIAVTYSNQGNYPVALEYYSKSLILAKINESKREIISTLGNMGSLYYNLKNYNKAIDYYNQALEYLDDTEKSFKAHFYNNLGLTYKEKKDNKLAFDYLTKGRNLFNETNNRAGEAYAINNIGGIYLEAKDFNKALEYFLEAKKVCLEIKNNRGLCYSYLGLAKVFEQKKDYEKALYNALMSKELSAKHQFLQYEVDVEELLSVLFQKTGNYKKALQSHQQFKVLNDSLFNKENIEKIAQLESEYKYKQAIDSASIRELKLNKTILSTSQDLAKTKQNYLWAVIGILGTSILSGTFVFHQKFKSVKIRNQNIVTEQKLLRSQMTPHFIFNSLSVLQGMILNKEEKKSITYLSKFSKLLRIVLENSRDKVVPLIQELDAIDNYMILQNLDAEPPYDYSLVVDENIDINLFLVPPMLIQPFIENAIEHAFTEGQEHREIAIHLTFEHKKLRCTITDNGIGIDAISNKTDTKKKSLATTITKERLEMLAKDFNTTGGITVADRTKDNEWGTRVALVIPYKLISNT